jgi:hypothetical protein
LIYRRLHSTTLDTRSFKEADYDSAHYLVVAEIRKRLSVSKQMVKKMDVERFIVNKLNGEEVKGE